MFEVHKFASRKRERDSPRPTSDHANESMSDLDELTSRKPATGGQRFKKLSRDIPKGCRSNFRRGRYAEPVESLRLSPC